MSARVLLSVMLVAILAAGCSHGAKRFARVTPSVALPPADPSIDPPPPTGLAGGPTPISAPTRRFGIFGPRRTRSVVATAEAKSEDSGPYLLDNGDRLRVFVYGQPNLSRIYTVDGGGFFSMPLIGSVKARGATTYELETVIAALLQAKYVREPKVTVEVSQYRPFFVLGQVRNAGQYPYINGITVQTAIAIAGGYTARAYEHKVRITRHMEGVRRTLLVPPSYLVRPGDTIYVKERFF